MDAQLGGNIGTAILSLRRRAVGRVHVIECSSYQIDLAPTLDPSVGILINLSEDHLDRHGTMEHYAAVKERLVAGVPRDGTAIVGVDDEWCRDDRRSARAGRQARRAGFRCGRSCPTESMSTASGIMRAHRRRLRRDRRARRHRLAARAAQCAERRLRRGGGAGARPRRRRRSRPGFARFPGLRIAWKRSAAAARCSSSMIPKPPMPIPRRRRSPASATFSGSPAASRRPAASRSLRDFFPRIRKAYLIGEAAEEFAATLATAGAARDRRHARQGRWPPPPATPKRLGCARAGRAAFAGLRLVRPVSQFRSARRRVPRAGARAAGAHRRQILNPLETIAGCQD